MAIPEIIEPTKLADYLAVMSRAIFQAGLSWALIESKWPAFVREFEGFEPVIVAAFGDADIDRLAQNRELIRTRRKIAATVDNARTIILIDRASGGFKNYLRSFESYEKLSDELKRRFKFLGELSVYYLLFRVGEPVPPFEQWEKTVPGDHPRMREMVTLARSQGQPIAHQMTTDLRG